ncbi:MAG TPA: hypothetical protein ENI87_10540 [bacterium]|nr:hypothetical protein [bacterium]
MRTRLLIAALSLTTLPACFQFEIQAQAGYANLAVDGDLGYVTGAGVGIDQDVESAFGLGGGQGSPYGRVQIDTGVPVLSVSAFQFSDEGQGVLQANFGGNANLVAGAPVASELDMVNAKVAYAFEIGLGPVSISPGVAVDYFNLTTSVRDTFGIATEEVTLEGPIPLAFLRAEADLGIVSAVAEGGYMAVGIEDTDGELLDLEAQLVVRPTSLIELFVGYRYINLVVDGTIDGDTFDTDLTLSGLMIGGGVRF